MRLEEVIDALCKAARRALEEKGKIVEVPGLPGYAFEWVEVEGELLPGLYTPPTPEKPEGTFDVGYGLGIARLCGLDYVLRSNCVIDGDTVSHMLELYNRGWYVRVWKPGSPDCWAEMVDELALEEGDGGGEEG